jgi:hypothetical protein
MAFFKDLFQHISDRIETVQTEGQPTIRWIDFDLGQLDEAEPPLSYPCALIGFGDAQDFVTNQDFSQDGQLRITIKCGFKLRERTHSKTTPQYRTEALEHLETLQRVHDALQGTHGTSFGRLLRTGIRNERKANIRVYEMDYAVQVYADAPTGNPQANAYKPFREVVPQGTNTPSLMLTMDIVQQL